MSATVIGSFILNHKKSWHKLNASQGTLYDLQRDLDAFPLQSNKELDVIDCMKQHFEFVFVSRFRPRTMSLGKKTLLPY